MFLICSSKDIWNLAMIIITLCVACVMLDFMSFNFINNLKLKNFLKLSKYCFKYKKMYFVKFREYILIYLHFFLLAGLPVRGMRRSSE